MRSQPRGRTFKYFYCDQEGHIKRNCPKYKAYDQSLEATSTTMMTVDDSEILLTISIDEKSDWILDSGSAYHLCRDKNIFFTYAACEGLVQMTNNMANIVVGKGIVQFCMGDERS